MSKEQINELATDIYSMLRSDTMSRAMASMLYDEGWGKQREGEWIYGEYDIPHCSECGYEPKSISPYCPNCGSKMKGGE